MIGFYCNFLKMDVEGFVRKERFVCKEGFLDRGGLRPTGFDVCVWGSCSSALRVLILIQTMRICVKFEQIPYSAPLVDSMQFIDETLKFNSFG